ncbi:FHA domain-containing protein [Paraliomyxa miuraensis]|uniref:FHA domain-containing protein n=1 Tax=Paraliomyxa miuraensis TaxID=376150 RepID=UPI002259B969|nr:FHA domain-containing protein [Paraliomyxa miuraensis]MCX4246338.1 FHA domain-containing protein [Paraliomyxa miuraensis]
MASDEQALDEGVQISDSKWIERKQTYSRDDFMQRHPFPFVLLVGDDKDVGFEFRTQTTPSLVDVQSTSHRVMPLLKRGANPYKDRIIVGRTKNCDLIIRSADISKYHADFRIEDASSALLRDRRSSNGTKVGDRTLQPNEAVVVRPWDRIRFGSTQLIFLGPGELWDVL